MNEPIPAVTTTAWGAAFLERLVLARTFDGGELSRGRGVVSRGGVVGFEVEPAGVTATVAGRSADDRRVRIGIRRFEVDAVEVVRAELARSGRTVAAVLDGLVPDGVGDRLRELGYDLLPGVLDVVIDCTCGNRAESCVHAAAASVRLAEELDRDPLLLLTLRGLDRASVLAGLAPLAGGSVGGPGGGSAGSAGRRVAVVAPDGGRGPDPGVSAAVAWRRTPSDPPAIDWVGSSTRGGRQPGHVAPGEHTGHGGPASDRGRPVVPPPAELGLDVAGLERLQADAAARAAGVLAGAASLGLGHPVEIDIVRRAAVGTLAPPGDVDATVARLTGIDPELVGPLVDAWRRSGVAGVEVLLAPRRLDASELAAVASAAECDVKDRSTGAVLADGRQVRRSADGDWVLLATAPAGGWTVVDAGGDLDDLL